MRKILISSHSRYPVDRKNLRRRVVDFLYESGIKEDYELGIFFVGDRKMKLLNERFMKHDGTTDVLSFPKSGFEKGKKEETHYWPAVKESKGLELGEIVLSYPRAIRQAMKKGSTVDAEVEFLVLHGLKHLLGFHHE